MAKEIGDKREKKLKISVEKVEEVIKHLLTKYDCDMEIESYVIQELDLVLNENDILYNNELKKTHNYRYQFDVSLYNKVVDKTTEVVKRIVEKDLNSIIDKESEDYLIKSEVYDNIFQQIDLTMYKQGISKLKLIAFHYLLKILERKAEIITATRKTRIIRGYKTAIEVFSNELLTIIAHDKDMEKFTLTLRSLIEQWLIKYNNRSKIGQFYYSILMINQEQVIEKILRYLLFTAIKNMNPIYLRAIFSTYVTLIHKNIFSFYALKLSNVKIGYFKQLESLFEDDSVNAEKTVPLNQSIIQNRLMVYAMKNKRFLKHNYEFLMNEYSSSFLEINYFDLMYSYDKDIPILDYFFYYSKFLKLTKNSFREQTKLYKINSRYFKPNTKKTLKLYLNEMIRDKFYNYFYNMFKDDDTVDVIIENIGTNLLKVINQKNFITSDFKKILLSFDDYLNQLSTMIMSMKKLTV